MESSVRRSQALDAWDYRVPFAPFHIHWEEPEGTPAFEQAQAFAIVTQELALQATMEVWAHREVLVTCASQHFAGDRPVPAWVVLAVGRALGEGLPGITAGSAAVLQTLVHAHTGEILLGTAVPVRAR